MKKFLFLILCLMCFALKCEATNLVFDGFISDNAHILTPSDKKTINKILLNLQNATKADVAVVTLATLGGKNIEDAALEIGRKYKLGDKTLNNGAVFIVALNERKTRIELGYGLEEYITDAHAGRILDDYVIPYFKKGEFSQGIMAGTMKLAQDISKGYNHELEPIEEKNQDLKSSEFFDNLFSLIMFIIFIIILASGGFGGGGFRGGGGGISFGGGGGFGGGGSTRGW